MTDYLFGFAAGAAAGLIYAFLFDLRFKPRLPAVPAEEIPPRILVGSTIRKVERRAGCAVLITDEGEPHWLDPTAVALANLALGFARVHPTHKERGN